MYSLVYPAFTIARSHSKLLIVIHSLAFNTQCFIEKVSDLDMEAFSSSLGENGSLVYKSKSYSTCFTLLLLLLHTSSSLQRSYIRTFSLSPISCSTLIHQNSHSSKLRITQDKHQPWDLTNPDQPGKKAPMIPQGNYPLKIRGTLPESPSPTFDTMIPAVSTPLQCPPSWKPPATEIPLGMPCRTVSRCCNAHRAGAISSVAGP